MRVKPGAQVSGVHHLMWTAAAAVDRMRVQRGWGEATITSGTDPAPGRLADTLHPLGCALDFRTSDLNQAQALILADELREELPGYDIVLESTHLHIELGPSLLRGAIRPSGNNTPLV